MVQVSKLRHWRERRLLTVRALASKADIGPSTIVRIEHGKPAELRTVAKLAQALNVTADQLLGHEDIKE